MSVKKSDRIANELRINCEHEAADLIERQAREIEEYKLKYEGKNLVWFERDEVHGLDPDQTGLINLAGVRARQAEASFKDGYTEGYHDYMGAGYSAIRKARNHANEVRNGKDGE